MSSRGTDGRRPAWPRPGGRRRWRSPSRGVCERARRCKAALSRRARRTTTTRPSSSTRRRCASTRTTSPSASRWTARSCARRRRTSRSARRLASTGKLEEALVEFQMAAELNPANGDIQDELRSTRAKLRAKVPVTREGKTQLETLIESSAEPGAARPRPAAATRGCPTRWSSATRAPRRLHLDRPLRGRQRRLRPGVPRRHAVDRAARCRARGRAQRRGRDARATSTR